MRAAFIIPGDKGGHVEVRTAPDLTPAAGQVLVKVRASGLNRGEIGQVKSCRVAARRQSASSSPVRWRRSAPTSPHGVRATASWDMDVVGKHNMRSPTLAP